MPHRNLRKLIAEGRVILFVGSGVSAGLGVPTWGGLIDKMANDLGYDPNIFRTSSDYFPTLSEYYSLKKTNIGELRSWMDRSWSRTSEQLRKSEVHRIISELSFPQIYTTNYDPFLEDAFELYKKDYAKIVSIKDIGDARDSSTQIIKFHGDFSDDNSIVLTESDYFERLNFESPLDIKLRSDALGKSILFIGYSLTDINIRFLLHRLSKFWKSAGLEEHQLNSYIFQTKPDPIQESVLNQWGVNMIIGDGDDPGVALEGFMASLQ